ncbi:uncharacterized protein LOC120190952 [Hibiscus syriacus]|uniref:uncharacterized protein LOC120190952 n=1 Tax=Hibiscus syriacus TaxID=106335 RepID=UPI001922ACD1|nr:uncharacterized protein LOC120190952 [Hibiscus syriacus]
MRGFNNPLKQKQVFARLGKLNVDIICLMETRVRTINVCKLVECYSLDWDCFTNHECSDNGRLWIFWRKDLTFSVLKVFDQSLSFVGEIGGHRCVITVVYGSNSGSDRLHLWRQLEDVKSLVGGPLYTWSNKQEESFLARKLDRVLINSRWLEDFLNSFVEFIIQGVSDHCPTSVVKESWNLEVSGSPMFYLFAKLKRLKLRLREFNKSHFDDISSRVKAKRAQIEQMQLANLSQAGCHLEEGKIIFNELQEVELVEASFYKQKAKVHWLKEGDRNTKFFYSTVMRKRKRNIVRLLYIEDGSRLDSFDDMSAEMLRFYTDFLGFEDAGVKSCGVDLLKGLLGYELPCDDAVLLVNEVSNEEIKASMFRQRNEMSPGSDGYTSYFFKMAWDIVYEDFLAAIRDFFSVWNSASCFQFYNNCLGA